MINCLQPRAELRDGIPETVRVDSLKFQRNDVFSCTMMMIRMKKQRDNIGLGLDNSMNVGNISLLRDARGGGPVREGAKWFFSHLL